MIEDRAGLRSTIITSQLPIALWHEAMGEPTVADAVADRLLANLHRIELVGESMRRPHSDTAADDRGERVPKATKRGAGASPPPAASGTEERG